MSLTPYHQGPALSEPDEIVIEFKGGYFHCRGVAPCRSQCLLGLNCVCRGMGDLTFDLLSVPIEYAQDGPPFHVEPST